MLADKTVRELLAEFAAPEPTPGGGSASALASAVGASLLAMVAALPKTRSGTDDDRAVLERAGAALAGLRTELTAAIDDDSAAYDGVVAAFKLPKSSESDLQARRAAIQRATMAATEVPMSVMRLSASAVEQAALVEAHGIPSAASDVGVAIALLRAGLEGARLNVEINLDGLKNADYTERIRRDITSLLSALR